MKYADLLQQARPIFDREDCCPVGAVFLKGGAPIHSTTCYPGIESIITALGTGGETLLSYGTKSGWWEIVEAWDAGAFDEDENLLPKVMGFGAALDKAREIDAREMT